MLPPDLRHALRMVRQRPTLSAVAIVSLAIGIGACTLMLSVVWTVLLKPLPYGDPDRLVMSWGWYPNANLGNNLSATAKHPDSFNTFVLDYL